MKGRYMFLILFIFSGGAAFAEDKAADNKDLGISAGADYYSTYLWRGTYFFSRDGAFCPYASYEVPDAGLKFSVVGEIAASYIIDGRKSQTKTDWLVETYMTSTLSWARDQRRMNKAAYAQQGIDYGVEYSKTIGEAVTLGASYWYWWYFNSGKARETKKINNSFMTATLSASIDAVKIVTPSVAVSYDYYAPWGRGRDWYVQIGLKREFELTKENKLTLGATAGYYYQHTAKTKQYSYFSYEDYSTIALKKWPVKKGVSDISPYVSFAFTKGIATFNAGFYWVIVPARTWHKFDDVHRFYAKIGASVKF